MNTVETQDFYLAAYLMAVGLDLIDHVKNGPSQTIFKFEDTPKYHEECKKYFGLTALVNPIAYGNCIRNLKSVIHMNRG